MQDYEQLPTRLSMDKRTMLRIIDQAVAGNRVSHYSLLMPTVKSGRGRYPCEVVCRVDADLHNDQDLLKEVQAKGSKVCKQENLVSRSDPLRVCWACAFSISRLLPSCLVSSSKVCAPRDVSFPPKKPPINQASI